MNCVALAEGLVLDWLQRARRRLLASSILISSVFGLATLSSEEKKRLLSMDFPKRLHYLQKHLPLLILARI